MGASTGPAQPGPVGLRLLITGACGVTSRTIARALRLGSRFATARLVGTDVCDNPFGLYEGLFDRIYRVPPQSAGAQYEQLLRRILHEERIDAAVVVPELEVLYWAQRRLPVAALLPPPRFAQFAISKAHVHECLGGSGLVPRFVQRSRGQVLAGDLGGLPLPVWLRDCGAGSTSGRGAICVRSPQEAAAWTTLHPAVEQFLVAQYLPGRNLACLLLFADGRVLKAACYERLEYFMAKTTLSGVTGNISQGRLVDDEVAIDRAVEAVRLICEQTGETMRGFVTVDLRCDDRGLPRVTEINLRQVAAASAFAYLPDGNMAEAQVLATLGRAGEVGAQRAAVPPNNRLLRDIDGSPQYVADFRLPGVGEYVDSFVAHAVPLPPGR